MRADDYDKAKLFELLSKHWGKRDDRYSELRTQLSKPRDKVEMSYIGG